ncbi:MAG: hypothetical protein JXX28_09175 [Deltaproteobacteria bacterium]|nr:hypothetical protein [Deltaproteobacteria bacterium]
MPDPIDSSVASAVEGLSARDLQELLRDEGAKFNHLSPEEIAAALERRTNLQGHIAAVRAAPRSWKSGMKHSIRRSHSPFGAGVARSTPA